MKKYISRSYWLDKDIERVLGNMLRLGVLLSACVCIAGVALYLLRYGGAPQPAMKHFTRVNDASLQLNGIFSGAAHLRSRSIMQLGVLLLLATPVMRVLFSFFAFLLEKDYLYVAITFIVLCVIGLSVLGGFA